MEQPDPDVVWVRTTPRVSALGLAAGYDVVVEATDDLARVLTPDEAAAYATALLGACARAAHDAAVVKQLTTLGIEKEAAAMVVRDLRADRPPLDDAATAPLRYAPAVSAADGRPFLEVHIEGRQVGQWEIPEAREHATAVIESVHVADLDGAYAAHLVGVIGLARDSAAAAVGGLAEHRT